MNEHDVERALRDWIAEDTDVPEPSRLRERVMAVPESAEVRTRWRWPRLEGWKRAGAVTASAAAAAVMVLLVLVLVPLGSTREPAALVVVGDGSADFATISDAVAAAADGDTILVRPGTYVESILIDRDITLRGDGDRDEIVITSPSEAPGRYLSWEEQPYAIRLDDADASVESIRLTGDASALIALEGSVRLANVAFVDIGVLDESDPEDTSRFVGLVLADGATAQVRDSVFRRSSVVVDLGAEVALENNEFDASWVLIGESSAGRQVGTEDPSGLETGRPDGVGSVVRGNVFTNAQEAIVVAPGGMARIEDNEIRGAKNLAIYDFATREGSVIRGNTISDGKVAIMILGDAGVDVSENDLSGNQVGLSISGPGSMVRGNEIHDNTVGVIISFVDPGTFPTLEGNTIEGNVRGISISAGASPILRGNVVCDNEMNLNLVEGAEATFEDNQICPDEVGTEAP